VIRRLQEMRRQYDLKVEDFIIVDAEVADDRICTLLKEKWQDGIAEEVRARELTLRTTSEKRQKEEPFGLEKEWDVEGIRMTLSLSKAPDQQ
jgi:isoleucyl-tRNA synthetase